jgi:hypothetical protein
VFLAEMERVVPWAALCALIEPVYPKPGNGRPPVGVERMLRIYFLQQWFNLSDPAVEEALYDLLAKRRFVGIDLGHEPVPDETTVCRFRHLLEEHDLGRPLFDEGQRHLAVKGLKIARGTIVDAMIISAPSSTKNADKARDPEMHQTKTANQWYFGMKAHVGVDSRSKLIHAVVATPANAADSTISPKPGYRLARPLTPSSSRSSGWSSKPRLWRSPAVRLVEQMAPIYWCSGRPRLRHETHLATPLKDQGVLIGILWLRAARESRAGIDPHQLGRGDRPGGALADLPRSDGAAADKPENSHLAHGETPRRLFQRELAAFRHFAVPVHGNAVGAVVRAPSAFGPAVALAGALAAAVEDCRDTGVRLLPSQGVDKLARFGQY